jgi:hypothetical protein
VFDQYIASAYWAMITMYTVGYGDITPSNSIEQLSTIIFIFLANLVFSYSITTIGNIVNSMNEYDEKHAKNMIDLNIFMNDRGVNEHLQQRIR